MRALIVSSSLAPESRSEQLAAKYCEALGARGADARLVSLKEYPLPSFDNGSLQAIPAYLPLHALVTEADALVLASPVYNWGLSAELKRFIEIIGSTPPDGSLRGAFFDKIVTFECAAAISRS